MENDTSSKTKRISLFAAGGLMMVSALLGWMSGMDIIIALCFGAAGLCFFGAGLNVGK